MRRFIEIAMVIALPAMAAVAWFHPDIAKYWRPVDAVAAAPAAPEPPAPDPETYAALRESLADWRAALAARHAAAPDAAARAAVLHDARIILETALPAMMRCWLGTPWDFHGTASEPGGGTIACGYFVSTVLRDAGFRVHRYHLAQQPSGNILRTFLPRASCKLTVGQPYDAFADALESGESGILIVGLDTHVGFIVAGDDCFRFIHSSGARPKAVVDESRDAATVLRDSNWRMLGHLTADPGVLAKWLANESFAVHGR